MPGLSFVNFSDVSEFTLNGDAAKSGAVLRVSPSLADQRGSAFLTAAVTLPDDGSFNTVFSFQISNTGGTSDADGQGADGILFVLHAGPNTAVGDAGGWLGYGSSGGAEITNSVGVGMDTWDNPGGPWSDPDGNHIEVNTSGTFPSDAQASVAARFNDGSVNWMWIEYDGTDLTVYHLEAPKPGNRPAPPRPTSPLITLTVDLPAEWGTTTVFAGFTSATAQSRQDHDILSWRMQWGKTQSQALPQVFVVG